MSLVRVLAGLLHVVVARLVDLAAVGRHQLRRRRHRPTRSHTVTVLLYEQNYDFSFS